VATFKICVFQHQKRRDGKYSVSIRVYWHGASAYIKTGYYVTDSQIRKKKLALENGKVKQIFELRDAYIIKDLNARIVTYEDIKHKRLGYAIENYTALQLAEYFAREGAPGSDGSIDFIAFARRHCDKLRATGRQKTASTLLTAVNALIDFCGGRQRIQVTEVTVKFLRDFETFLKQQRMLRRLSQKGKVVETTRPGLSDAGVHDYLTAVRILFNAAMDEYNDEDRGEIRIKHYPFRKFKISRVKAPEKRTLAVEQVKSIIAVPADKLPQKRAELARDVFLLSLYLAGTNLADLFYAEKKCFTKGRFSYNRQKTKDRRQDAAYISIKVFPEAEGYFNKYRDAKGEYVFSFARRYADHDTFQTAVNKGLVYVAKVCDIPKLTSYYARFSFATIARNDCGVSRDDIDLALNHVDQGLKMTDGYIKKDWTIVDKTIRAVLDYILKP